VGQHAQGRPLRRQGRRGSLSSGHHGIGKSGYDRAFGTRLIETLGQQLKGDVKLTYEPTGFVYALDVPLASLTSTA
jgi:hypothetical protein